MIILCPLSEKRKKMTYEEAKVYIEEVSRTGSILGLESIIHLMKELGNVQETLRIIHIGGTNGKGSTGAFIESILIEAGYVVGRYTSPAVFETFEVWRMNRTNISLEDYLECLEEVKKACERMLAKGMAQPTVFEVETALAFVYFAKKNCDYVLLEVGMGGETDATNLISKPVCSVLTSISMDHMQFLGNTLEAIAKVKAGIIKKDCPVITSDAQKEEVRQVIGAVAEEKGANLILAKLADIQMTKEVEEGQREIKLHCTHRILGQVLLGLIGTYQLENANLAISACKEVLHIPHEIIKRGLENTSWPGRFEVIHTSPTFILDGAHNEDAAKKLAATLQNYFTNRKITYIIGVLADKEHKKMLELMLPFAKRVYTVTPQNKRALAGEVLAAEVESLGFKAINCAEIHEAVKEVLLSATEDEVIVAFGSLSYLSEVKKAAERLR